MPRCLLPFWVVLLVASAFLLGSVLPHDENERLGVSLADARREVEDLEEQCELLTEQLDQLEDEAWGALAEQPAAPAFKELRGKVVTVMDGDTITLLDESNTRHRVRLLVIDAPDKRQAFGPRAKQALSGKVFGKLVIVAWTKRDKYGRVLGDIHLEGRWVNEEMVADGFAWHYEYYDKRTELANAEKEARKAKRGLWIEEEPEAPWKLRGRTTAVGPPIITLPENPNGAELYWLNTKTNVRHNQGCRWFNKTTAGRLCRPDEGKPCKQCKG